MGTNYYTKKKDPCPTCGEGRQEYHIGKSSGGWKFLFASYPEEGLTSYQAWWEFLKGRDIYDEYNDPVSYDEFFQMVHDKQVDPRNITLYDRPEQCMWGSPERFETIDDDGYRISTTWDFS